MRTQILLEHEIRRRNRSLAAVPFITLNLLCGTVSPNSPTSLREIGLPFQRTLDSRFHRVISESIVLKLTTDYDRRTNPSWP